MTGKSFTLFALVATSIVGLGCDGLAGLAGNNSGQPVGQIMPDDVTLDVSELPEENAVAARPMHFPGEDIAHLHRGNALFTSGGVIHGFHRAVARALKLGAEIRDDMSDPTNVKVAGEFEIGDKEVAYLADFSAFDFDGDGTPDGSGNAVDVPVALRLWTDRGEGYQPFMCALITVKPTEETDQT